MGAFDSTTQKPTGTDKDEYDRWVETLGGQGVGELVYDDPDDARDAAEFNALTRTDSLSE